MTKEHLAQLVTVGDLHSFKTELIDRLGSILKNQSIQEFYSPKEFAAISGLKYSTVVNIAPPVNSRQPNHGQRRLVDSPFRG